MIDLEENKNTQINHKQPQDKKDKKKIIIIILIIILIILLLGGGAFGLVYISKNWKVSIAPVTFMVILFICVPTLASSVGILVPVGILISLGAARIMYKKGWLA